MYKRQSYEREAIRSQGKRVKYQFTNDGYQVAKGVEKEEFALGLPKIYRDFSAKEKTFNILGVAALVPVSYTHLDMVSKPKYSVIALDIYFIWVLS